MNSFNNMFKEFEDISQQDQKPSMNVNSEFGDQQNPFADLFKNLASEGGDNQNSGDSKQEEELLKQLGQMT